MLTVIYDWPYLNKTKHTTLPLLLLWLACYWQSAQVRSPRTGRQADPKGEPSLRKEQDLRRKFQLQSFISGTQEFSPSSAAFAPLLPTPQLATYEGNPESKIIVPQRQIIFLVQHYSQYLFHCYLWASGKMFSLFLIRLWETKGNYPESTRWITWNTSWNC